MVDDDARCDEAFAQAWGVARPLLDTPELVERWTGASALPAMSVGALACHLGRQVTRVAHLLVTPSTLPVLDSADDHYARAAWVRSTSPDDPANDRSDDDAEAVLGAPALLARVDADLASVRTILRDGLAERVVPIPWQGWALRRPDFLLTRLVETVVHSADLAVSLGQAPPEFPDSAFRPVSELLLRLAVRRHGQGAVVGTLSRRERTGPISAF
jgi:hypothetical protein